MHSPHLVFVSTPHDVNQQVHFFSDKLDRRSRLSQHVLSSINDHLQSGSGCLLFAAEWRLPAPELLIKVCATSDYPRQAHWLYTTSHIPEFPLTVARLSIHSYQNRLLAWSSAPSPGRRGLGLIQLKDFGPNKPQHMCHRWSAQFSFL